MEPRPALADQVHVWRAELDWGGWPASGLPAEERMRAARLPDPGTRGRWVASRWALRAVLARYLDEDPAGIALRLGENGKPALADRSAALRFNLSHSAGLALIAVAREREVGVDVERIAPRHNLVALASRALDATAAAAVIAAPDEDRSTAFHEAWARREAVVKCLGTGLRTSLPATQVAVSTLDPGAGFAAAVALAAEAIPPLRLFALPAEPAAQLESMSSA